MHEAVCFGLHLMASAHLPDYFQPMINQKHFLKANQVGFVLGAVLMAALSQGVGNADAQNAGIRVAPPVVVVPIAIPDDYVYYPNYGIYYNSHRHQYLHLKDDVWVTQPVPEGISVQVLLASPSVNMEFHDSPEKHHAEMLKRYPRDWKPAAAHQERKEDHRDASPDHDKK